MKFFDLHCDTVTECSKWDCDLFDNTRLHISLKRGEGIEKWCQFFALWVPDEFRGQNAFELYKSLLGTFRKELARNAGRMVQCKKPDDLAGDKVSAILSVEGGCVLMGDEKKLDVLADDGVKMITLTWNGSNKIGHGSRSGCADGLTDFGKLAVRGMSERGIVPDVSHLNERGFFDVADVLDTPFVASHSNCSAVFEHPRNLTDEQIKIIVERGGLIGLNLFNEFLGGDGGCDTVYAHLSHILDLGGEKTAAIGSDFDGCDINPELAGVEKMGTLYEYFLSRGLDKKTVDDVFFDNAYRFWYDKL